MPHKATAAIFDLDGVLLDTEPLYTVATQAVVGRYGKTYEPEHKRHIMGRSDIEGAHWLVKNLGLPLTAQQYLDNRRAYLEDLFQQCPCIEGARSLVASLRDRGVRLALATSSDGALFRLKTARHAWFSVFEYVICGDDARLTRSKPSPDIFLLASQGLGVSAEDCVVFEDSVAGVEAALAAGMKVVARWQEPVLRNDLKPAHLVVTGYDEIDIGSLFVDLGQTSKADYRLE